VSEFIEGEIFARVADKVHRGAQYLDVERPGWAEAIELSEFNMQDGEYCVLGQLHGGDLATAGTRYTRWLSGHGKDEHWARTLGFETDTDEPLGHVEEYDLLHDLWVIEVGRRNQRVLAQLMRGLSYPVIGEGQEGEPDHGP
jgi:hypothetical protein